MATNHFPLVGLVFSIALAGYAFIKNDAQIKIASLWAYSAVGLSAVAVYITGEPAEELVEHMPGVTEAVIERHEEAATVALIFLCTLGIMAGAALFMRRRDKTLNAKLMAAILALSVVSMFPVGRASNLGGQIRHTEIRPAGTINNGQPGFEAGEESGEGNEEEESDGPGLPEPANK